jgi:hypothetical protein
VRSRCLTTTELKFLLMFQAFGRALSFKCRSTQHRRWPWKTVNFLLLMATANFLKRFCSTMSVWRRIALKITFKDHSHSLLVFTYVHREVKTWRHICNCIIRLTSWMKRKIAQIVTKPNNWGADVAPR